MIHALLSVLLCSTFCTLALSVVYSNDLDQGGILFGCHHSGNTNIPGFLIDEGAPTQMACASEPHRSAPWSAKIMSSSSPARSDIAYVINGITARPNRPLFFSFWLKTGSKSVNSCLFGWLISWLFVHYFVWLIDPSVQCTLHSILLIAMLCE